MKAFADCATEGRTMRWTREPTAWVVYTMAPVGKKVGHNAVCSQDEWDAMEVARPGFHTLVRGQIGSEGEAEQLARKLQTPAVEPCVRRPSYSAERRAARQAATALTPQP